MSLVCNARRPLAARLDLGFSVLDRRQHLLVDGVAAFSPAPAPPPA